MKRGLENGRRNVSRALERREPLEREVGRINTTLSTSHGAMFAELPRGAASRDRCREQDVTAVTLKLIGQYYAKGYSRRLRVEVKASSRSEVLRYEEVSLIARTRYASNAQKCNLQDAHVC